MLYDLHTHSHCSDGLLSPTELVALAQERGVHALALTDHDTLAGIEEARAVAQTLTIISGVELSAQWQGRNIHIVGLDVDVQCPSLTEALRRQSQVRVARAQTLAQRLQKVGVDKALEGARQYSQGDIVGRPHFARYMVEAGYVKDIQQAFDRYLGAGKIGDIKLHWPCVQEAVAWIVQASGIAVLAHPDKYALTRTKLYRLIGDFADAGGKALEVVSGQQDKQLTDKLMRAANHFSLLASSGSDFHAPEQFWRLPGSQTPLPSRCKPVWEAFKPATMAALNTPAL